MEFLSILKHMKCPNKVLSHCKIGRILKIDKPQSHICRFDLSIRKHLYNIDSDKRV